jgi:hypothetical protein
MCLNLTASIVSIDNVAKSIEDSFGTDEHLYDVHTYKQQLKKTESVASLPAKNILRVIRVWYT